MRENEPEERPTPLWTEPDRPGGKRNNVIVGTVDEELALLREWVLSYERRYQCGSREMLEALRDGKVSETLETNRWMNSFHDLVWLAERSGRTIGIPIATTRPSTTAI